MRATALPVLLSLLQAPVERPEIKQTERKGELGPWTYEDFREEYYRSDALARRRQPFRGVSYAGGRHRYGVMQGQSVFRHRERPLWLVHNLYCTQLAMTAEVPWECEASVFVLEGTRPEPEARREDGYTVLYADHEVEIEGDFEAIEPHPTQPLFAALRYGCCDSPVRVSVHHFDGRTLCAVRELPYYPEWRGQPWETIGVDAKAVKCPDGTRVPLVDARPVQPLGAFNDFRVTEEHQYGHGVELWRVGEELAGFLLVAEGLQGDTPAGLLEDVAYDAKTRRISFGARLTGGTHGCRQHRDVPSRDVYRFEGVLKSDRVEGLLTRVDALHPGREARSERVVLKTQREALPRFESAAKWQQRAQWILAMRGPRW